MMQEEQLIVELLLGQPLVKTVQLIQVAVMLLETICFTIHTLCLEEYAFQVVQYLLICSHQYLQVLPVPQAQDI
jgi:hypothetical protein